MNTRTHVYLDGIVGDSYNLNNPNSEAQFMEGLLTTMSHTLDSDITSNYWEMMIESSIQETLKYDIDMIDRQSTFHDVATRFINLNGDPTLLIYIDGLIAHSCITDDVFDLCNLGQKLIDNLEVNPESDDYKVLNYDEYDADEINDMQKDQPIVGEHEIALATKWIKEAIANACA